MSQMTQMAEDLARNAGGHPPSIVNAVEECRCEANHGTGSSLGDSDLWPSASSVDGLVLSHRSMATALADPATARNLAAFSRNYFDALKAAGFSEEQAMQIVVNQRWPLSRK